MFPVKTNVTFAQDNNHKVEGNHWKGRESCKKDRLDIAVGNIVVGRPFGTADTQDTGTVGSSGTDNSDSSGSIGSDSTDSGSCFGSCRGTDWIYTSNRDLHWDSMRHCHDLRDVVEDDRDHHDH